MPEKTKLRPNNCEWYRSKSTVTLEVVPPKVATTEAGVPYYSKMGSFQISITPHDEEKKRKWDERIRFQISVQESFTLDMKMRKGEEFKALHDPNKATEGDSEAKKPSKSLTIKKADGAPGYNLFINQGTDDDKVSLSAYLAPEEMGLMLDLMSSLRAKLVGMVW